jgi:hypothetical protein
VSPVIVEDDLVVEEDVVAGTGEHHVGAVAAGQDVVPGTGDQGVVARPAARNRIADAGRAVLSTESSPARPLISRRSPAGSTLVAVTTEARPVTLAVAGPEPPATVIASFPAAFPHHCADGAVVAG